MITAIDTNVLLDILAPDPQHFQHSLQALEPAASAGSLVICDNAFQSLRLVDPATQGRGRQAS